MLSKSIRQDAGMFHVFELAAICGQFISLLFRQLKHKIIGKTADEDQGSSHGII